MLSENPTEFTVRRGSSDRLDQGGTVAVSNDCAVERHNAILLSNRSLLIAFFYNYKTVKWAGRSGSEHRP